MFGKMLHHLILHFYKYSLPVSITSCFYLFITNLLLITYFDFQLIILTWFNLTHNSFPSDLLTSDRCGSWSWDLAIPNIRILILIVGLGIVVSAVLEWIKKKTEGRSLHIQKKKMWLSQSDSWSLSLVMWWHLSLPPLEGHPTTPPRSPDDVCTPSKRDLKAVRQQTSAEGRAAWFLGGRLLGGWKAPEEKKKASAVETERCGRRLSVPFPRRPQTPQQLRATVTKQSC